MRDVHSWIPSKCYTVMDHSIDFWIASGQSLVAQIQLSMCQKVEWLSCLPRESDRQVMTLTVIAHSLVMSHRGVPFQTKVFSKTSRDWNHWQQLWSDFGGHYFPSNCSWAPGHLPIAVRCGETLFVCLGIGYMFYGHIPRGKMPDTSLWRLVQLKLLIRWRIDDGFITPSKILSNPTRISSKSREPLVYYIVPLCSATM